MCFYLKNTQYRGVEQLVARRAHNPEVARSNRASATNESVVAMVATKFEDLEIVVRFHYILIYSPMA